MAQWTEERRKRQAEAIHRWRPWEHSTGPRTIEGKRRSSGNAFAGAVRPQMRLVSAALRSQAELLAQMMRD